MTGLDSDWGIESSGLGIRKLPRFQHTANDPDLAKKAAINSVGVTSREASNSSSNRDGVERASCAREAGYQTSIFPIIPGYQTSIFAIIPGAFDRPIFPIF
jgi:hypothetical protein